MGTFIDASFLILTILTIVASWVLCWHMRCSSKKFGIIYRLGGAAVLLGLMLDSLIRVENLTGSERIRNINIGVHEDLSALLLQLGIGVALLWWTSTNLYKHKLK